MNTWYKPHWARRFNVSLNRWEWALYELPNKETLVSTTPWPAELSILLGVYLKRCWN